MIACKYCIATKGVRGVSGHGLFETEEALFEHLESVHGITVRRDGETEQDARVRFEAHYGSRDGQRIVYQVKYELDVATGRRERRHIIMDNQLDYPLLELSGQAKILSALGPLVAKVLDSLGVTADVPQEVRDARNPKKRGKARKPKARKVLCKPASGAELPQVKCIAEQA
jgi:hypothetical protein